MNSRQFEKDFSQKNSGQLWDDSWNEDAHAEITLTIADVRFISNVLRRSERRKQMKPLCPLENTPDQIDKKADA